MKHYNTVKLTLLRHVLISAAAAAALSNQQSQIPQTQEIHVYSDLRQEQVSFLHVSLSLVAAITVPNYGSAIFAESSDAR